MSVSLTCSIEMLEYDSLNEEIKRTMCRSARDAVQLGFMLRRMMEERIWAQAYDCFDSYLDEELHMEYSMATRFININRRYSVMGNSAEIAEEYEKYSQGLLIEMLNMPPELEARVTPDMTVKQARELKRQAREEQAGKEQQEGNQNIPGQASIEEDFPECLPEENIAMSQLEDQNQPEEKLSPYGLPATVYPEGSLITTKGCGNKYDCFLCAQDCAIRQENRHCAEAPCGSPFACTTVNALELIRSDMGAQCQFINLDMAERKARNNEPDPCCKNCNILCGFRCNRSVYKGKEAEDDAASGGENIIDGEYKEINEPEPEGENIATSQENKAHDESWFVEQYIRFRPAGQPGLPVLKNNDQRREWLADYKSWGLWYRDENIDVNYYKYDFPDGSRLIVAEYPKRMQYYSTDPKDEHYYHLLEKNRQGYDKTYDEQYRQQTDSETYLVEFLKNLQKKA